MERPNKKVGNFWNIFIFGKNLFKTIEILSKKFIKRLEKPTNAFFCFKQWTKFRKTWRKNSRIFRVCHIYHARQIQYLMWLRHFVPMKLRVSRKENSHCGKCRNLWGEKLKGMCAELWSIFFVLLHSILNFPQSS